MIGIYEQYLKNQKVSKEMFNYGVEMMPDFFLDKKISFDFLVNMIPVMSDDQITKAMVEHAGLIKKNNKNNEIPQKYLQRMNWKPARKI
jgi:hypothetical protein